MFRQQTMSTSEIQEETSVEVLPPIGSGKVKDFLDMFSEMTGKKLPTLLSIPRESHLAGIKNYRIWRERMPFIPGRRFRPS